MLRVSLRYTRFRPTTQFRFNVEPVSQPIADSMLTNCLRRWPTLLQHWVCFILSGNTPANMCHLPNTVSMMAQRLRRWPEIETALRDYPGFDWTAMQVTFFSSRRQEDTTQITMLMSC